MSEYQCYEFLTLDRPLTSRQREELRQLSTRAEITTTRFTSEYWDQASGELGGMVAVRLELLAGDHRLLYLAWLMGTQLDRVDDEDAEPRFRPASGTLAARSRPLSTSWRLIRTLSQ